MNVDKWSWGLLLPVCLLGVVEGWQLLAVLQVVEEACCVIDH